MADSTSRTPARGKQLMALFKESLGGSWDPVIGAASAGLFFFVWGILGALAPKDLRLHEPTIGRFLIERLGVWGRIVPQFTAALIFWALAYWRFRRIRGSMASRDQTPTGSTAQP